MPLSGGSAARRNLWPGPVLASSQARFRGLLPRCCLPLIEVERAAIPPASLVGAVAQLGERLNGIQEVRGSIPLGSTR